MSDKEIKLVIRDREFFGWIKGWISGVLECIQTCDRVVRSRGQGCTKIKIHEFLVDDPPC